jgi:hypothetical protein
MQDMKKNTAVTIALSAALLGSSAVGANILATDAWLWAAAPTHAYGLIAFAVLDVALVAALWRGVKYSRPFAIGLAAVQFMAMAGDLAGLSLPSGVSATIFRNYLLNDSPFVILLAIQPVIAGLGVLDRAQATTQEPRQIESAT